MSTPQKSYRYPGVQPFSSDQQRIFFGRQEDTQRLLSLMLQERLCVLFGKSGHGKSSLLNAGIIPTLAEKGKKGNRRYVTVTVRFNTWTPQDTQTLYDKFVFHLNKSLSQSPEVAASRFDSAQRPTEIAESQSPKVAKSPPPPLAPSPPPTLWGAVKQWNIGENTGIVLLFDQFEEFFSYPQEQQSAFKEQLAELLYVDYPQFLEDNEDSLDPEYAAFLAEKTDVRALLSIRADRLSDLDRLKDRLPAILHKRYELRALDAEQARQAVVGPAGEEGGNYRSPAFAYDEAALLTILRELTGREGAEAGRIEAFLLQIVCASIEKRVLERGLATVQKADLPDFDTVFDDYYQDRIGELPPAERTPARRVLEQGLLLVDPQSGEGRRLSRDAGELAQAFSVSPALLENLERTYLLRREVNSLGSFSYELSHDTLIGPVMKSRKEQEAVEEAERLEQERIDAETRAREAEEKAAEEKRKAEEAERLKNEAITAKRRATWFAWGAGLLAVMAVAAFIYANSQSRLAQSQSKIAEERRIQSDSSAANALKQQEIAVSERIKADSSAMIALEQTRIAKAARKKADDNLLLAKREEARAKAALEQVKKEKDATEAQRRLAENNFNLAQQKTKEAEKEADNARKALEAQKAAHAEIARLFLPDASTLIRLLDYEAAREKIQSVAALEVAGQAVSDSLLEIAFFYAETNRLDRAWSLLHTAYTLVNKSLTPKTGDRLAAREALRRLNPRRDSFLQARYFPVMIEIPGGTDTIGSGKGDEKFFVVTLSDYQLAESETTWWQYNLYCAATGKELPEKPAGWGGEGDNPVVNVSWYDATAYAGWLSDREDLKRAIECPDEGNCALDLRAKGYRLPTEAEWEYAARADTNMAYAGCDQESELIDYAWYGENSGSRTQPVKTRLPNRLGLYDMSGNVWEWCWDWYGDYPSEAQNPIGPETGSTRVLRGGAWNVSADFCRVANRRDVNPGYWSDLFGFRLSRTR
ncbi:MAG: SUMF1/EgtB/PvdO family nonheme iron enzyme [Saprospiraceae bacterium]|nr:SUMF1/EgtB/PvdO family nonheme iron enzyme [Saprospiraceae bacterium]